MRDFAIAPELVALQAAAERLGRNELAPNVRDAERAGRWPDAVLTVLDGLPLGDLDLPERLGGVEASSLAKVITLERLAMADAGGLPGADRIGPSVGALLACPDISIVTEVVASLRSGAAQSALTVVDIEHEATGIEWAPGWPALRWIWVSKGDEMHLHEVTGTTQPTEALAFHASGGVSVSFTQTRRRGTWTLSPHQSLSVRGRARLWGAAIAVGIAQAALTETISYTTDRIVFGKPVAHHQGNAFDLAAAAARLQALASSCAMLRRRSTATSPTPRSGRLRPGWRRWRRRSR